MSSEPGKSQSESSAKPRKHNRRRQFIVDKPFQYRMIGLLLAIWTANSLFFSIVLYYFYQGHILRFYELVPRDPNIGPLISSPVLFTIAIGFIVVFGMVMVGILGLYLSNQIAGPLYRVKLSLNRVSEGDVNFEIRFRDRDFLEDFPGYFNNMLRALKERSAGDLEVLKSIEDNLEDSARCRTLLRELREKKERQLGFTPEPKDSVSVAVH